MPAKDKFYDPWTHKAAIGRLLKYQAEAEAFEQLMWQWRYGKGGTGYRGCPYCHASGERMGIGRRAPTHFPVACKNCGKVVSATLDTPMYRSKISLPIWFDCIYLFMGGYHTKDKKVAPIEIAALTTTEDLQQRYEVSYRQATALKFGARNMVFPSDEGMWGDELPGMYVNPDAEGGWARFEALLQAACNPAPKPQPVLRSDDPDKLWIDVGGIPRKYKRACKHDGREFATDMDDRWYCCNQCRDAAEATTSQRKLKEA